MSDNIKAQEIANRSEVSFTDSAIYLKEFKRTINFKDIKSVEHTPNKAIRIWGQDFLLFGLLPVLTFIFIFVIPPMRGINMGGVIGTIEFLLVITEAGVLIWHANRKRIKVGSSISVALHDETTFSFTLKPCTFDEASIFVNHVREAILKK